MFKKVGFLAIFLSLFLLPMSLLAMELHRGDVVFVAADQKIDKNYYAAGQSVEIYGEINGDLFLVGQNIIIDSENINGDIFAAGSSLTIKGQINGSVRFAGERLNIYGQVSKNGFFAGQIAMIGSESVVGGHMTAWGQQVSLRGQVTGDLEGGMDILTVSGQVGQDIDLYLSGDNVDALQLTDEAIVDGSVRYHAWQELNISEQAQIGGEVVFNKMTKHVKSDFGIPVLWSMVLKFFGMLVVGMLLIYLLPKLLPYVTSRVKKHPARTLFIGLATLILTPIISILLMITIIGLPLAFIILGAWVIALYVAKVLAAWLVGSWLKNKFLANYKWSKVSVLALGILVYVLICKIPIVGWIAVFILYLWAWGVITSIIHRKGLK